MNEENALEILKQALNLATTKGAYTLEDTHKIIIALEILSEKIKSNNKEL